MALYPFHGISCSLFGGRCGVLKAIRPITSGITCHEKNWQFFFLSLRETLRSSDEIRYHVSSISGFPGNGLPISCGTHTPTLTTQWVQRVIKA